MHSVKSVKMFSIALVVCMSVVIVSGSGGRTHRSECDMWSKLENKTLPLQNQGHAKCVTNQECTGFSCNGIYQGKDISFGMRVLPCQTPPGVEIFGYAPQYNAKNFSHIFTHKAEYEVPGALLNISMLPKDGVKPGAESLIKAMLEIHLKMNHDNDTLTLGLTAKACINHTCIFSKPVFNNTEIPVPDCPNDIPMTAGKSEYIKAYSACKMSDIAPCGRNQVCEQQESESRVGICSCLPGFSIQDDKTCLSIEEEDQLLKEAQNRPKKSTSSLPAADIPRASSSPVAPPLSAVPQQDGRGNSGAVAAVVVSLLVVLVVVGGTIAIVKRTTVGTRLRARLTNTPYADIIIGDRNTQSATQMGSTTTLESEAPSRTAFA